MNEATAASQSELDFPLLGTPSECDSIPTLDFPWTSLAKDLQFGPTEECIACTANGSYTPTHDEFTGEFGLKDNPADPLTFPPQRNRRYTVDGLDPLSPSLLISENRDSDAHDLADSSEARDTVFGQLSPASTRPARSRTSTCSATPVGESGASDIERHRERNRVAARKCRQKTKRNVAGLQRREKELGQQNKALVSCVRNLREEILDLKTEILKHSNCDNAVIQKYIANAARRQIE